MLELLVHKTLGFCYHLLSLDLFKPHYILYEQYSNSKTSLYLANSHSTHLKLKKIIQDFSMISRLVTWTHIRPRDFWQYCPSKHNLCDESEILTATILSPLVITFLFVYQKNDYVGVQQLFLLEEQSKHGSWAVIWFKRFELHNYYQLYFFGKMTNVWSYNWYQSKVTSSIIIYCKKYNYRKKYCWGTIIFSAGRAIETWYFSWCTI